jgi:hypothetical protein
MEIALIPLLVGIIVFALIFVVAKVAMEIIGVDARIAKLIYLLIAVLFVIWLLSRLLGVEGSVIHLG